MKDEKKRFHNPKRIVILVQNRKNKIKIDLRTAQEKMLPKLDESQRKKVTHFVLKVRQVNNSNFERAIFFICGFSPGFQVLPQKEFFKVDFQKEPRSTKQEKFKHKPQTLLLYLRVRKKLQLLLSPLVFQSPLEFTEGINLSIFLSMTPKII